MLNGLFFLNDAFNFEKKWHKSLKIIWGAILAVLSICLRLKCGNLCGEGCKKVLWANDDNIDLMVDLL